MSLYNDREADRRSFGAINETCPTLDSLRDAAVEELQDLVESRISTLIDAAKEKATIPLREALTAAHLQVVEAGDRIEELERDIAVKESWIADLEGSLARAEARIAILESEVTA
jgi:hypothetical protein